MEAHKLLVLVAHDLVELGRGLRELTADDGGDDVAHGLGDGNEPVELDGLNLVPGREQLDGAVDLAVLRDDALNAAVGFIDDLDLAGKHRAEIGVARHDGHREVDEPCVAAVDAGLRRHRRANAAEGVAALTHGTELGVAAPDAAVLGKAAPARDRRAVIVNGNQGNAKRPGTGVHNLLEMFGIDVVGDAPGFRPGHVEVPFA